MHDLLHLRALCYELPSDMSTMVQPGLVGTELRIEVFDDDKFSTDECIGFLSLG